MLRTQIVKLARASNTRAFSAAATRAAAGDTGSVRSGGSASGDAFSKREKANEDYFVKEQEKQKLRKLKEKLAQQKAHLEELGKSIDELEKERGGEQN